MRFLEFGMKYCRSKNPVKRFLAFLALKIADAEVKRMEKYLEEEPVELSDEAGLEQIFDQIRKAERDRQSD